VLEIALWRPTWCWPMRSFICYALDVRVRFRKWRPIVLPSSSPELSAFPGSSTYPIKAVGFV
jgi:hypothetical protein